MNRLISDLIIYSGVGTDTVLGRLGEVIGQLGEGLSPSAALGRVHREIKNLLDIATDYGFDGDLWQDYLTYLLITDENSFSLTCEKSGPGDGSVNGLARHDYAVFSKLFAYDFSWLESRLGTDCFSILKNYRAIPKRAGMYNKNVSKIIRSLSPRLAAAADEDEFFTVMTDFYRDTGVGMLGLNKAFRIREGKDGVEIFPINNTDDVVLEDLVGLESQKKKLTENTESFVARRPSNNCLLYGDAGTGKSTSIKAVINRYYGDGLRMIEIYKHQFRLLSDVIAQVKNRNYSFIIYMDDLSFEDFETEYKYLKAVIEGGVEKKPDNVLIYATSNRRHLIRESWSDRSDMEHNNDVHRSDTMQEKLSLYHRFGVTIGFFKPDKKEYNRIVKELASRQLSDPPAEEELLAEANKWEISHGGASGRSAQQFINYLAGHEV